MKEKHFCWACVLLIGTVGVAAWGAISGGQTGGPVPPVLEGQRVPGPGEAGFRPGWGDQIPWSQYRIPNPQWNPLYSPGNVIDDETDRPIMEPNDPRWPLIKNNGRLPH